MKHSLWVLFCVCLVVACANQKGLSGGDKDEKPPEIVYSSIEDSTLNFHEQQIVFSFNEFIRLINLNDELTINPYQKTKPEVKAQGKNVRITFIEGLDSNTTYVLNLGSAVVDNNEGNALSNLKLTFSTGKHLDEQIIRGLVSDAWTLEPQGEFSVCLYKEESDSLGMATLPDYLLNTSDSGTFSFGSLPKRAFYLMAFKDENRDAIRQPSEKIAWMPDLIYSVDSQKLFLTAVNEKPQALTYDFSAAGPFEYNLAFNQRMDFEEIRLLDSSSAYLQESSRGDSLRILLEQPWDSVRLIAMEDTLNLGVSLAEQTKLSITNRDMSLLPVYEGLKQEVRLLLKIPIQQVDTSTIHLTSDSNSIAYSYKLNNTHRLLSLFPASPISGPFSVSLDSAAFQLNDSVSNDKIVLSSSVISAESYGSLHLAGDSLKWTKGSKIGVFLYSEQDKIIKKGFLTEGDSLKFNYLQDGNYSLRYFEDANNNGVWDSGSFLERRRPERVGRMTQVVVRAGWDSEGISLDPFP